MEESYETLEEEFGAQRAEPLPQKPIRQIRRPEMYATRKIKEDMASVPQQIKAEPKILAREPSFTRSPSLPKTISTPSMSQNEVPWESVTLNRCLFIAITILVLTSGVQRLHEALHGHKAALEEDVGLTLRRSGTTRHRAEPEITLWEVVFSWLPDLDDEDDEDKDDGVKKRKPKRGTASKTLSGLRNKLLADKKMLKQRDRKIKGRPVKKSVEEKNCKIKESEKQEDLEEAPDNEQKDGRNKEEENENSLVGKKREKKL